MKVLLSLVAVLILAVVAILGAQVEVMRSYLFGMLLPYAAIALFIGGFIYRVVNWGKSPVPFRIPTSCGQQVSLPWIKSAQIENPHTTAGVIGRMALEVLFFRSLFRNTRSEVVEGPKVIYGGSKWLWAAAMAFHWTLLVVLLRHLRFSFNEVPGFVRAIQWGDGFFQIGVPVLYLSTIFFLGGLGFLLIRRLWIPQVRYISLLNDYFPLFLLLGIGLSGVLMRHFIKTDIVGVKELVMGLIVFKPVAAKGIHWMFFVHLFLVCVLFAYFPFSKLMHMGGVFMSPTRNLANDSRMNRHVNPWNHPVKVHTYEEYEDDFREKMIAAGIPVDKEE